MASEPEARSSRGLESRTLRRRRVAHLIAGEVEADHPLHAEPAAQVQSWGPADLEVVDVLRGRIHAQLVCDALERGLRLHDSDRGVEILDVVGLAGAIVRSDHPKSLLARQLFGSRDAHRAVKMRVKLGLLPAEIRA